MNYVFQFGPVWRDFDQLLLGAWLTIRLSAGAMALGLLIAIPAAIAKTSRYRLLRGLVLTYVETIRNTPFLIQLFLIFLGLPSLGVRLTPTQAALAAMVINLGAYATEIVRAGIEAVPRGQIEAGKALGLRPWQVFRFIVMMPALKTVFPALGSQFILVMLGSSVVSAISAEELSALAAIIQSRSFRSFEVYLVVAAIYLGMSLAFEAAFGAIYRSLFVRPGDRR